MVILSRLQKLQETFLQNAYATNFVPDWSAILIVNGFFAEKAKPFKWESEVYQCLPI
jgi:hypothetical protein